MGVAIDGSPVGFALEGATPKNHGKRFVGVAPCQDSTRALAPSR